MLTEWNDSWLVPCPEGEEPHRLEVPRRRPAGLLTLILCEQGHVFSWEEAMALVQGEKEPEAS